MVLLAVRGVRGVVVVLVVVRLVVLVVVLVVLVLVVVVRVGGCPLSVRLGNGGGRGLWSSRGEMGLGFGVRVGDRVLGSKKRMRRNVDGSGEWSGDR